MSYYSKGYNADNVISYPQIVMEQVQIIQKVYSKELRDGDKVFKNAIGEQIIEGEDTRYSFLQSVEFFGSLLSPYFIDSTKEPFENYCNLLDKEIVEMLDDKNFIKEAKKVFFMKEEEKLIDKIKEDKLFKSQLNIFLLNYKVKEARKLFRILVDLFKAHDFLANQSYTDSETVSDSMTYIDEGEDDLKFDDEEDD